MPKLCDLPPGWVGDAEYLKVWHFPAEKDGYFSGVSNTDVEMTKDPGGAVQRPEDSTRRVHSHQSCDPIRALRKAFKQIIHSGAFCDIGGVVFVPDR